MHRLHIFGARAAFGKKRLDRDRDGDGEREQLTHRDVRRSAHAVCLVLAHAMVALADFVLISEPGRIVLRAGGIENPLAEALAHRLEIGADRLPRGGVGEVAQEVRIAAHETVPDVENRIDLRGKNGMSAFEGRDIVRAEQKRGLQFFKRRGADGRRGEGGIAEAIAGNAGHGGLLAVVTPIR